MQKFAATGLLLALLAFPASIQASLVGTAFGGVALPKIKANSVEADGDTGYDFGVSLGWQLNDWLRWDAFEFHYISANHANVLGTFTTDDLALGSGARIGIFKRDWRFHPFISAGVGGSRISHEQGSVIAYEWVLEWNAGAGVEFQLDYFTAVGVRYRYRSAKLDTLGNIPGSKIELSMHTIGIEFAFGGE